MVHIVYYYGLINRIHVNTYNIYVYFFIFYVAFSLKREEKWIRELAHIL